MSGSNGSRSSAGGGPRGGDPDAPEEGEEEEYAIGEVPKDIYERAETCRTYVLSALGVELDFEPETLPVLDEYLRMASAGVADRPQLEPLITLAVAAYYGEVVRRRIDAFWKRRADPNDEWELCARRVLLSMSPLGMVMESLARGEPRGGPSADLRLAPDDERLAEARLAAMPPVSEEEYYLLSTRLEVLETIYEALRDQMKAEGRESLVFEDADYDDE